MATKYPTAAGAWSTRTWNDDATGTGTTAPGAGDTVLPNNFAITIDQDISVAALSNAAGTTAAAGGGFTCSSARTIAVSGNVTSVGAVCLTLSATSITITASCSQSIGSSTTTGCPGIVVSGGNAAGIYNIAGTPVPGSQTNSFGIQNASGGTVNLTGASSGTSSATPATQNNSTGTFNITGNVTGGSSGAGMRNQSTGAVSVTGNVTGGSGNSGISNNSSGTVTVNGSVNGGSVAQMYGIQVSGAGRIICNGAVNASSTTPAIGDSANSTAVIHIVNGPVVNDSGGTQAIYAPKVAYGPAFTSQTVAGMTTPPTYSGTVVLRQGGLKQSPGMNGGFGA